MKKTILFALLIVLAAAVGYGMFVHQKDAETIADQENVAQTQEQEQAVIEEEIVDTVHTSRNSLDWAGEYHGITPCADCPGIEMIVTLGEDGKFREARKYLERTEDFLIEEGRFEWNELGNKITALTDSARREFLVQENRLVMLDMEGKQIEGDLAELFVLKKRTQQPTEAQPEAAPAEANPAELNPTGEQPTEAKQPGGPAAKESGIQEKHWRLKEAKGAAAVDFVQEPYMTLKAEENRVMGNGGCNRFVGMYALAGDREIEFSGVAITRMACIKGMDTEDNMMKALNEAVRYEIEGDTLKLFAKDGQAPLAVFEAVSV
ncbi:MAG: copper resistance protein NlpE N-terminal domain-containing protein [Alphaproteobacteria bacterium]|nr:copper resistance protein NlpE N-terminal domain-containing protein [Alphaproteobacteria bacterium]MCL2505016.1 copper resistance protein NlpE N-terminal domain-containing protein [Alphaproteobacteria bacterium]